MNITKRNQKIITGLKNGESFRSVADKVGVHHRTAQRVAARAGQYSARSYAAYESDFNSKGAKVFRKFINA
jgi:IS30 family transposase